MPFVAFGSGLVWLISVRSVTGSLFILLICVRIRFESCDNQYLAAFVLSGLAICFYGKMLCLLSRLFSCLLILSLAL